MNKFWLKMAGFAVIIVGLIVLVKVGKFVSSGIREATDFEKKEELHRQQEDRLQAELAEAERKARETQAAREAVKRQDAGPSATLPRTQPKQLAIEDQIQAQRLYIMAETEYKIARKPMMTYHRMVRYCRELLERYPGSPEAAKARVLLRKMPERHRKRYKITNEELGLPN